MQSLGWRVDSDGSFRSKSLIERKLPIVGLLEVDGLAVLKRFLFVVFRVERVGEIEIVFA